MRKKDSIIFILRDYGKRGLSHVDYLINYKINDKTAERWPPPTHLTGLIAGKKYQQTNKCRRKRHEVVYKIF